VKLIVKPFLQDIEHGVFATRSPCRPNPIGLSIVELLGIEDNILHFDGADIIDGTPLIDIKPYSALDITIMDGDVDNCPDSDPDYSDIFPNFLRERWAMGRSNESL